MNGQEVQKKNWWSRNWKWFVPVGCLGSLALFAGLIGVILCVVFGVMRSSDVYKEAMAKVKANPAVTEALGSPIKEGFLVSGNMSVNGPSGNADLSIPVSGPKGKAVVYVVATMSAGKWSFATLDVVVKGSDSRITIEGGQ